MANLIHSYDPCLAVCTTFMLSYRIQEDRIKAQLELSVREIGFTVVRRSAVSMILMVKDITSFHPEKWAKLREIDFDRSDILELVFTHNGAIQFSRLKKEGNKGLSLAEYRNAIGGLELYQ